jgi:TRAP-type C4-dicarboxylate transport system permease small subunit
MLKRIIKILGHFEELALAYVSLTLGILIVLEIILRTTGITAFFWLEELGRYVLIFMTLCGASLAVKYGRHPSMTALFNIVPTPVGHVIKGIAWLFLSVFFAFIDYYAWSHIGHINKLGLRTSTLGVPFTIPYLPIGIFFLVISIRYFLAFVREIQAFRNKGVQIGTEPEALH